MPPDFSALDRVLAFVLVLFMLDLCFRFDFSYITCQSKRAKNRPGDLIFRRTRLYISAPKGDFLLRFSQLEWIFGGWYELPQDVLQPLREHKRRSCNPPLPQISSLWLPCKKGPCRPGLPIL